MEFTNEMLHKAKNAESSDALLALAKENGWDMTQEEANAYFDQLHKTGELSDQELENVTGGGCRKKGHLVVTVGYGCNFWRCKNHNQPLVHIPEGSPLNGHEWKCPCCGNYGTCGQCIFCKYTGGLWLCMNPNK